MKEPNYEEMIISQTNQGGFGVHYDGQAFVFRMTFPGPLDIPVTVHSTVAVRDVEELVAFLDQRIREHCNETLSDKREHPRRR